MKTLILITQQTLNEFEATYFLTTKKYLPQYASALNESTSQYYSTKQSNWVHKKQPLCTSSKQHRIRRVTVDSYPLI